MLSNNVKYKINIDYSGEYRKEDKDHPVLAIRVYIESDAENPLIKYGINMVSDGTYDYEHAVKTLSNKLDRWFARKYNEDISSEEKLLSNERLKDQFGRLLKCSPLAIRNMRTKIIIDETD